MAKTYIVVFFAAAIFALGAVSLGQNAQMTASTILGSIQFGLICMIAVAVTSRRDSK
ncbi:MAG TPA: hypothetical protein VGL56_12765 [Fimbriimonadaceae bacterium]